MKCDLPVMGIDNWTLDNNYMYKVEILKTICSTAEHIVIEEHPWVDYANCAWYWCQEKR